jgi:hypothetical protein
MRRRTPSVARSDTNAGTAVSPIATTDNGSAMGGHDPEQVRAVIMLRSACDTAVERFNDSDIEELSVAVRINELRDMLDGYLAEAGRRISAHNNQRPV